jgi:hypothetical protein
VRALASQLGGRHLLLWSSDPVVEAALDTLDATGKVDAVLPRSTFHVAVESVDAAKLAYYVRVRLDYSISLLRDGGAWVTTSVTQINDAPAGQPASYQPWPGRRPSTHRSRSAGGPSNHRSLRRGHRR